MVSGYGSKAPGRTGRWVMGVACVLLVTGGSGCDVFMPNTGIASGKFAEYVEIVPLDQYVPTNRPPSGSPIALHRQGSRGNALAGQDSLPAGYHLARHPAELQSGVMGLNAVTASASGLSLGGDLAEKVASAAAKIAAQLLDEYLEDLEKKFGFVARAGYANEPGRPERLYFVRGIRIPVDTLRQEVEKREASAEDPFKNVDFLKLGELDDPKLSLEVCKGLLELSKEEGAKIDLPNQSVKDMEPEDRLRHGWFELPRPDDPNQSMKVVQFVATRLSFKVRTGIDQQEQDGHKKLEAIRIVEPELEVYATGAHIPNLPALVSKLKDLARYADTDKEDKVPSPLGRLEQTERDDLVSVLNAKNLWWNSDEDLMKLSRKIWALLDETIRDQFSVKMTVSATISAPSVDGPAVTLGDFSGTLKGIWPTDTRWDSATKAFQPARRVSLESFDSLWIAKITDLYNIKVTITETSNMEEWIGKLREALQKQVGTKLQ